MSNTATHQTVIAAVDGSAASTVAVARAARDAVTRRLPRALVHVLPGTVVTDVVDPHRQQRREKRGQDIIDDAVKVASQVTAGHPLEVQHHVIAGNAVHVLADMSSDAVVVAVGARGQGTVKRPLWGSIPTGLVRHGHCPGAVMRDDITSNIDCARAPILLGIDVAFEIGDGAVGVAFDEASLRGVGVLAVHCCGDHDPHQVPIIDRGEQLEEGNAILARRLVGWERACPDVAVERRLVHGDAVSQLVKASLEAQLTVIGGHGRIGGAATLLGSVSSAVVQALRTPVIITKMRAV